SVSSCSSSACAARRRASGWPAISARNESGNFPNHFIARSVRCRTMGVKVAIVGAWSTYTPELVEGFIRRADRFPVDELALLDVDPSRLEVVGGLARRLLDRAAVGGGAGLLNETIPPRFGCIGQETTGAGGFAKALRTVPVVLELAELTSRRGAPGCWFVDFTNPTGLVTQALLDRDVRAVGLCNVAIGFQRRFAERFGVEPERGELEDVGLNPRSWGWG